LNLNWDETDDVDCVTKPEWQDESKTSWESWKQYFEIHNATNLPYSKPQIMNYSNMAMVWAKIVLHKDVDWLTTYGKDVCRLDQIRQMIPTNWDRQSNCWPRWSN
jgi:hypothetical protein